ncbi:MAG: dihydrofolate reductase [Myxococcales bacterium]|nr:dihydrofolate reductase [Myxococcales bacterium]
MRLTLIAAVADNGVIGRDGDLPWRLSADLAQFKARTLGRPILMGRKTWESLPRRPLKDRLNVVLTRRPGYVAEGAVVTADLDAAIDAARASGAEEAFVIGGESIYAAALPLADAMVLTHVEATVEGDARFPDFDASEWIEVSSAPHAADEKNAHAFRVVVYERRQRTTAEKRPS